MYGIGDCVNTNEFKMAAHAEKQGVLIASNIVSSIKGQPLKPYQTGMILL